MTFFLKTLMGACPKSTKIIPGKFPTKIMLKVLIDCLSRSRGQKELFFSMHLAKIFLSETTRPRDFIFGI